MAQPRSARGDNLYPAQLTLEFGSHRLDLDVPQGVWNPTPHGIQLGQVLASSDFTGQHVLELGTGCGIHAILLARQGARQLTLTEVEQEPLDNARYNLDKHGVSGPVEYLIADWTQVPGGPYDVVVTNPPFARSGKSYRRYFIDSLILDSHKLVRPGGRVIFVQSSMADIPRSIRLMEENAMTVQVLGESDGPFRSYYLEDPVFRTEMAALPGAYSVRDGVPYERLIVLQGTLPIG